MAEGDISPCSSDDFSANLLLKQIMRTYTRDGCSCNSSHGSRKLKPNLKPNPTPKPKPMSNPKPISNPKLTPKPRSTPISRRVSFHDSIDEEEDICTDTSSESCDVGGGRWNRAKTFDPKAVKKEAKWRKKKRRELMKQCKKSAKEIINDFKRREKARRTKEKQRMNQIKRIQKQHDREEKKMRKERDKCEKKKEKIRKAMEKIKLDELKERMKHRCSNAHAQ
ncbi:hypothetical protein M8J76_004731 [Diaphorina citri]|nr:hypothetical protein M8J75_015082 [Diaphorina citri]KAI5732840.1 hypothetical protein M8J76_004731 [Diaphorina citri]